MKKKMLATVLSTMLLSQPVSVLASSTETMLVINNQPFITSQGQLEPQVVNDRVYVPLRVVTENLGHHIEWAAEQNQIVITTKDNNNHFAPMDNQTNKLQIIIDGQPLVIAPELGEPFVIEGGHTMIPLRAVANGLGCEVLWEPGLIVVEEKPKAQSPIVNTGGSADESEDSRYQLTILGDSLATVDQMNRYLSEKQPYVQSMLDKNYPDHEFSPYPDNIAQLYLDIGKKYHIRGDLAFAQAVKETGYFQFYGSVSAFQNNYCGLGATGVALTGDEPLNGVDPTRAFYIPGLHGLSFATPADGVEAHIQHLYAYATSSQLPSNAQLVDPRFKYVQRGAAPRWIDLNGRWAVPGDGYGQSIIDDYWSLILTY